MPERRGLASSLQAVVGSVANALVAGALAPAVTVNAIAPGWMDGTRMSANWSPDYAAGAASRTLLKRAVDKDDVAEQLITFCRGESVTGQTILMDSGRV